MIKDIAIALLFVIVCLSAGILGSFSTASNIPTWYAAINKPSFNPPNYLFGPVWTFLYISMGVAAFLVWKKGFEKKERDWNMVETKCVAMGDSYCEFKVTAWETDELKHFLESVDSFVVERVYERLMDQLTGFIAQGKPLPERPRLGNRVAFNQMFLITSLPALASERYRMAVRMGGARAGKEVGKHLMEAGIGQDEVIKRVIDFMEYCKVGKITLGETIRMKENCESFGLETGELTCFFTTGFLNGLFSVVKNKHVREIKCIAAGDPHCEWEII